MQRTLLRAVFWIKDSVSLYLNKESEICVMENMLLRTDAASDQSCHIHSNTTSFDEDLNNSQQGEGS